MVMTMMIMVKVTAGNNGHTGDEMSELDLPLRSTLTQH